MHRSSGRASPHTTPLLAVWAMDGTTFTTGENEQKAKNLGPQPEVLDIVVTATDA